MLLGVFQPKPAAASASCRQIPSSSKADTALSCSAGVNETTTMQVLYGCAAVETWFFLKTFEPRQNFDHASSCCAKVSHTLWLNGADVRKLQGIPL